MVINYYINIETQNCLVFNLDGLYSLFRDMWRDSIVHFGQTFNPSSSMEEMTMMMMKASNL